LSDLVVSFEPGTLARVPVDKGDVVARLDRESNVVGRRIAESLPCTPDGRLDDRKIDALLVDAHRELQRLSEEFDHARRVAELVTPVLDALAIARPRVVDVGCGLGYVLRALAHGRLLARAAELIGVDFNAALVEEASRLARLESLDVSFQRSDALALEPSADVYLSTGVLHHFRRDDLRSFIAAQMDRGKALVHFDFQPSPLAPVGAWLFHHTRFRTPLARHDGVLSAIRAHSPESLLRAAVRGPRGFRAALFGKRWAGLVPRVFVALVVVREDAWERFVVALGRRASRLGTSEATGSSS
jgi:SAM-dependent methyltransferase